MNVTRLFLLAMVVLASGLTGCGRVKQAAERSQTVNDLKELGLAYMNFQDTNGRPPKSLDELAAFSQKMQHPLPAGVSKLTVFWGAGMLGHGKNAATSDVILAYGPTTNNLVPVLMGNGATNTMTTQEFESARKAKSTTQ
jgi:hypothetical protein